MQEDRDIVIVTPVLNDWPSLAQLMDEMAVLPALGGRRVTVVAVDDGSTIDTAIHESRLRLPVEELRVLRLCANQGHQRAIALGLAYAYLTFAAHKVVVMDSDGEDRPQDIPQLLEMSAGHPAAIVVAQRKRRSEGLAFRLFYQVYKGIFVSLTGRAISFGNFCVIPGARLSNVIFNAGIWNNFAGTVLKCRVPIVYASTNRGARFHGKSTMSFISLMVHGLSAISIFTDVVVGRLIVLLIVCSLMVGTAIIGVVLVKLFTDVFVPGYATNVILFLISVLVLGLFNGTLSMLALLAARDRAAAVPTAMLDVLLARVDLFRPAAGQTHSSSG